VDAVMEKGDALASAGTALVESTIPVEAQPRLQRDGLLLVPPLQ
jgi:hypothetical protein